MFSVCIYFWLSEVSIATMTVLVVLIFSVLVFDCYGQILECMITHGGHEYQGTLNQTRSGYPCQRWDSQTPHQHGYNNPTYYPDATVSHAENHCRNPDQGWGAGTWCYINSPQHRWQSCDVPFCECKVDTRGFQYMGTLSVTSSGLTCQSWDSPTPHPHNFTRDHHFPDLNLLDAGNHCRNPSSFRPDGPWCYTTSETVEWEYCNVVFCDGYPVTTSLPSTTTPTSRTSSTQTQATTESHISSSTHSTGSQSSSSIHSTGSQSSSSIHSTESGEQSSSPTDHYPTSTTSHPATTTTATPTDSQPTSHYQTTKGWTTTGRSPRPSGPRPQGTPQAKATTSGGGSSASVAGIVVGVLLLLLLVGGAIGVGVWWRYYRSPSPAEDRAALETFDNPLYDKLKNQARPVSGKSNPAVVTVEAQT